MSQEAKGCNETALHQDTDNGMQRWLSGRYETHSSRYPALLSSGNIHHKYIIIFFSFLHKILCYIFGIWKKKKKSIYWFNWFLNGTEGSVGLLGSSTADTAFAAWAPTSKRGRAHMDFALIYSYHISNVGELSLQLLESWALVTFKDMPQVRNTGRWGYLISI